MKKINLKGISETLSEKELKNVMGGSINMECTISGTTNGENDHTTGCGFPVDVALALCQYWWVAGANCECHSC